MSVHPMYPILSQMESPANLRTLSLYDLPFLAREIREYMLDILSEKEGHLGASFGVVELTIALHYCLNTPTDKLVWDVGHQCYAHKILTERSAQFKQLREWSGISGFPKRSESPFDAFGTGHSSTSLSAILGMALGAQINQQFQRQHIAVIGDASFASGMVWEALNQAGNSTANCWVILNDNGMSIDQSVGAWANLLQKTSIDSGKSLKTWFEPLGFRVSEPIDGHDLPALIAHFNDWKTYDGPRFTHIKTTKGKGLSLAEMDQVRYHAPGKFDRKTGLVNPIHSVELPPKYQDVFGHTLVHLANNNKKIVGITPAMPSGSSMGIFMKAFPERAFDVGIAEPHAVTLAGGLASDGFTVYCSIYSTFLQRAYDQLIHDIALQELPVIFCIDRAGFVGEDGATHHGIFDIAFLNTIPNVTIWAPFDEYELQDMLYAAQFHTGGPLAIRYPRGRGIHPAWEVEKKGRFEKEFNLNSKKLAIGSKIAVMSTGVIGQEVQKALNNLPNCAISHYHVGQIKPLDHIFWAFKFKEYNTIVTVEEGSMIGGFGSAIAHLASELAYKGTIIIKGVPDVFIEQGTIQEQRSFCRLDADSLQIDFEILLNH
ncbi:MAG: 1-deoxy-D-xylulose-5-phosphate synthase [Flavobacterium sp. BFFFF2]|nr:MAG: 1-deoxy-D-xylulose-5-phosphate synthase [Flavobacterium sp. BFFFF2]